jgi:hypothetical protein
MNVAKLWFEDMHDSSDSINGSMVDFSAHSYEPLVFIEGKEVND